MNTPSTDVPGSPHRAPGRTAYLLEFADTRAARAINALRWLAAPGPRRAGHITLRGPYPADRDPTSRSMLAQLDRQFMGAAVKLRGIGQFQRKDRRTVYLQVHDDAVQAEGSSDNDMYLPHVTLYSGRDASWASAIEQECRSAPELTVRIAAISTVLVGRIENPLDRTVVSATDIEGWLRPLGLTTHAAQDSQAHRLRAIASIIAGLTRDEQSPESR